MKSLFIKDIQLMKRQKNFLIVVIVIAITMMILMEDILFPLWFITFFATLFPLSTLSYDDFENGNAFLLTLPIRRQDYVYEKYGLGLLSICLTWMLVTSLGVVVTLLKEIGPVTYFVQESFLILPAMIVMQAITIPFQLKFGSEKRRMVILALFGLLIVISLVLKNFFKVNIEDLLNQFTSLNWWLLIIMVFGVFGVSVKMSSIIMNQKEY